MVDTSDLADQLNTLSTSNPYQVQSLLPPGAGGAPVAPTAGSAPVSPTAPDGTGGAQAGFGSQNSASGQILARLRSANQPNQNGAFPQIFSGVPNVQGQDRGAAFLSGLSGGLQDQSKTAQAQWQAGQEQQKNNLDLYKTLFDADSTQETEAETSRRDDMTAKYYSGLLAAKKGDDWSFNASAGKDQYGNPTPGFVNSGTGQIKQPSYVTASGQPAPTGTQTADPTITGPTFLKTLDPAEATKVQAIAEGRMQLPSGYFMRSPQGQKLLSDTAQYDPTFDAVNYNARAATRKDFTAGKSAQTINSLNTAIGHIGDMSDAIDGLNNTNYPVWNGISNAVGNQLGDTDKQSAIAKFQATAGPLASELTKTYRQAGGSEADVKRFMDGMDPSASPATLHSNLAQISTLLESKLSALQDQYQTGMGTTDQKFNVIRPAAQAVLDRVKQRDWEASHPGQPMPAPGAPAPAAPQPAGGQQTGQQAVPTGAPPTAQAAMPNVGPAPTGAKPVNDGEIQASLAAARAAIAQGKDPTAVKARLQASGIDPGGL